MLCSVSSRQSWLHSRLDRKQRRKSRAWGHMVYLDSLLRERLHLSVILGELTDTVVVHHEILALRDRRAFACERALHSEEMTVRVRTSGVAAQASTAAS